MSGTPLAGCCMNFSTAHPYVFLKALLDSLFKEGMLCLCFA